METPPCEREFITEETTRKPIIAVVTATGVQGRSVCRAFWKSGYWHVRALTRDPSGEIARLYAAEGIEVVQADFEKKRELEAAFQGAFVVFSVTIPPWHKAYSNTLSEYEQGVIQVEAAISAGVQLFLWSTLPHVGPEFCNLGGVELYDSKARIDDYISRSELPAVFVGTPAFIDNVVSWPLVRWTKNNESLEFWNHVVQTDNPVAFLVRAPSHAEKILTDQGKWVERDLGPAMLALADSFYTSNKPPSEHPLNHTLQPLASWRGSWGAVSRCIQELTGIPTKHKVLTNADQRWHSDLTKAFIYQNVNGLYPSVRFPPQTFLDLGVHFGTLEEYVRQKVIPALENRHGVNDKVVEENIDTLL